MASYTSQYSRCGEVECQNLLGEVHQVQVVLELDNSKGYAHRVLVVLELDNSKGYAHRVLVGF